MCEGKLNERSREERMSEEEASPFLNASLSSIISMLLCCVCNFEHFSGIEGTKNKQTIPVCLLGGLCET